MNVVALGSRADSRAGRPIRVGMLVGSVSLASGGVSEAVRSLCLSLRRSGLAPEIFSLRQPGALLRDFSGIPLHLADVKGPPGFGYASGLSRLLRERQPDILHVHGLWMYQSVAARRWAAETGHPYLASPHGMLDPWALGNSAWKKRLAWRLYEGAHLRSAALIHALCEPEREAIARLGLPEPVVVVPNGVDPPPPRFSPSRNGRAPWRDLPETAKVLLFLGRVTPKKRVAELLRAWARVSSADPAWHLAVVGPVDDGYREELDTIVRQSGLSNRIHMTGPAYGDVRQAAYASADAFILPSISEGLPMAVLEAFANGMPALLTRQCNLPEAFADGCALAIGADELSISEGLLKLFAMPEAARLSMAGKARGFATKNFDWDAVGARFAEIYSAVLADRGVDEKRRLRIGRAGLPA